MRILVLGGRSHCLCQCNKELLTTGTDGKPMLREVFLQRVTMCQVGQKDSW